MISYRLKLLFSSTVLCFSFSVVFSEENVSNAMVNSDQSVTAQGLDGDLTCLDDDENYELTEFLDTVGIAHISRAINPVDIMILFNLFGIPKIIEIPFFFKTNILNKRSLLDQPIFEPDRAEFPGKMVIGTSAFVRKTNRSNFTKDSDKLNSFLSISEGLLIERLQDVIDKIRELNPIDEINVAKIFALFENMTVEERQAGFMVHCMKKWRHTTFRIMTPFYYLESNFSLTPNEQDAVAKELGVMSLDEEKAFRKAHFISDKIGIGDTRIEVDGTLLKRPAFTLRFGGLATIPTTWTWGKGFVGSSFAKPSTLPTFELDTIINAVEKPSIESQEEAIAFVKNFLLDSFDRIAADLIDVPLGNRRHLGLGTYIRGKTPLRFYFDNSFAQRTHITNRISLECFLPATEKRFYIDKIDEAAFAARDFESTDPVVAADNLQFLKEQMVSRLFLRAFNTRIIPGVIFRWSSQAHYKGERYGFNLGTDFWLQNKDIFSSILVPSKTLHEIDIPKAKPPVARQSKVFGGIILKHKTDKNIWFFSLNADATLNNKGLGQDYSIALNFESSF